MRLIAVLVSLSACATTPSRVRGIDGFPLSTTALLDADAAPIELHCNAGPSYLIVAPPHEYLRGMHFGTEHPFVHDAVALCARITAE